MFFLCAVLALLSSRLLSRPFFVAVSAEGCQAGWSVEMSTKTRDACWPLWRRAAGEYTQALCLPDPSSICPVVKSFNSLSLPCPPISHITGPPRSFSVVLGAHSPSGPGTSRRSERGLGRSTIGSGILQGPMGLAGHAPCCPLDQRSAPTPPIVRQESVLDRVNQHCTVLIMF